MNREEAIAAAMKIDGWSDQTKLELMYDAAKGKRLVVEIGVYKGRSLVALAAAVQGTGICVGIDPYSAQVARQSHDEAEHRDWWGRQAMLDEAKADMYAAVRYLGLNECVSILELPSSSLEILSYLDAVPNRPRIDALHIDGGHGRETALGDTQAYYELVAPGGLIVLDDTDWPSVRPAVRWLHSKATLLHDGGKWRAYVK